MERLAKVYERGAFQKGARNWEQGIPFSRCIQSSIRHINQYIAGKIDEDHLMQAAWNLFAIAHYEKLIELEIISEEFDDIPKYESRFEKSKKNDEDFPKFIEKNSKLAKK